jgi:hypothetical protein
MEPRLSLQSHRFHVWNTLQDQGYYHFSNVFSPLEIKDVQNSICENESKMKVIQYKKIEEFIHEKMLRYINKEMEWDCVFAKYRVSDNNNSSDAGAFHRDVMKYNNQAVIEPCFTCLVYLDSTTMEVIPGSHKLPHMSKWEAIQNFSQRVRLSLKASDVLLFYSSLLHRGIFTENLPRRRLIQVFDVFPNRALYDLFGPQIVHIPATESSQNASSLMEWVYKKEVPSAVANWLGYLNAATGYGYQPNESSTQNSFGMSHLMYSSEGTRPRLVPKHRIQKGSMEWEPSNHYVFNESNSNTLPEGKEKSLLAWKQYTQQYVTYAAISALILICLMMLCFWIYRNTNRAKCGVENSLIRKRLHSLALNREDKGGVQAPSHPRVCETVFLLEKSIVFSYDVGASASTPPCM